MRSFVLSFSLLFAILLSVNEVKASHLIGAEIIYKQIDTKKFRFDFIFYRDCNGVPFSNPSSNTFLKCKNGSSYSVNLTLLSIKKIDLANDTSCSKSNTTGQGTGFEEHHYYCIIDFDSSPYSSLYNCSETLIMETSQCCRTSSISTGLGGTPFYTYAELNLNASNNKNSSPVFSTQPIVFLNGNQSVYQTFNAIDTIERDSLSYSFSPIKTSYNNNATYNNGYNYYQPFKAFYPGTLKYPFYNLDYKPVIGIYLDENTGDLVYTPIKLDEVTSYAVEVTEWRKDSTNNYIKIGSIRREIMGIVRGSTYNSQPEITVKNRVYYVFEEDSITIDFGINDEVLSPPPPYPSNSPDSVTINWVSAIPGATFDISRNSTPRESAKFRWTPKKGTISNVPYTFVVTAKDNHAGFYGITSKTYSFFVINRPTIKITNKQLGCNTYEVNCNVDTNYNSVVESNWEILDSDYKPITDTSVVVFIKTKEATSTLLKDTFKIKQNGKYYIQQSFGNTKLNSPVIVYDSIELRDFIGYVKLKAEDTTVCPGTNLLLLAQSDYKDKTTYLWHVSNDSSWQKTDSILLVSDFKPSENRIYSLTIENKMGCSSSTDIKITVHASYPFQLNKTYISCEHVQNVIDIGGKGYHSFVWNNKSGLNTYEITVSETIFLEYKDAFDCQYYDTVEAIINPNLTINLGNDTSICFSTLKLSAGVGNSANWSTNDTTNSIIVNKSGIYSVKATDLKGCTGTDTIKVTIYPKTPAPVLTLTKDTIWANQAGKLSWYKDDVFYKNTDSNYLVLTVDGTYSVDYLDSNGCTSNLSSKIVYIKGGIMQSSIPFKIYPNPNNGKFFIELEKILFQQIKKIELHDLVGKKVSFTSNNYDNSVEIANNEIAGFYTITIVFENGENIRQIVVFQK